jgi:predicted NUDIX family phosphoesterase
VEDANFPMFLDRLGEMFSTLPSAANATIDLDEDQITKDVAFISNYADARDGLEQLVSRRQAETASTRLHMSSTVGFEGVTMHEQRESH